MDQLWTTVHYIIDLVRSVIELNPTTLNEYATTLGPWLYAVLFLIIFAETGLVVTPFLPGDSLLFAVGAVAAHPDSPIRLGLVAVLLVIAAILGDAVNYYIGYSIGPRVFSREESWLLNKKHLKRKPCHRLASTARIVESWLLNKKHLKRAHDFYEEYGGKTIILARFIPIVRTFAPFVAGIGKMSYRRFAVYNVAGGTAWILLFLLAGWWFGAQAVVQKNFKLLIGAIIVISVLPGVYEYIRARRGHKPQPDEGS